MPKLLKKQEKLRKNDNVQSILIPKTYSLQYVCPIVLSLGYNCFDIDETKNFYRIRQFNPGMFGRKNYETIKVSKYPGVKMVIEY